MNAMSLALSAIKTAVDTRDQALLNSSLAAIVDLSRTGVMADARVDFGANRYGPVKWIGTTINNGNTSTAIMVDKINGDPRTDAWKVHTYAHDGSMTFTALVMDEVPA